MGGAKGLENYIETPVDILVSYYGNNRIQRLPYYADLFLDSGAFSAFRKKETLCPIKYAEFIKTYEKDLFVYAGLDVIGNPTATWENQKTLERMGTTPLPCFHFGEDIKWLHRYLDRYDYIAIGGLVPHSTNYSQIKKFLDRIWETILTKKPDIKVHGFGIQNQNLMERYPWFSVDASSVHMQARYGGIMTPSGWVKINPNVNPKEIRWRTPLQLKKMRDWITSLELNFTFEEAQETTPNATLMRCAISIKYYSNKFGNNYKPKTPNIKKKGLL
jgi:hypothetical protein